MLKIRLTRLGKHKDPFYRIVAVDSKTKRDGGYKALLGTFDPNTGAVKLKKNLVLEYLAKGAQPTETVLNMFKKESIWVEYIKSKKVIKKHKRKSRHKLNKTKDVDKIKSATTNNDKK